jgi:hypothetical protein
MAWRLPGETAILTAVKTSETFSFEVNLQGSDHALPMTVKRPDWLAQFFRLGSGQVECRSDQERALIPSSTCR